MELGNHTYAVLLAGGEGVRFHPLSTPDRPKQFLPVFGDRSLLQQTVDRLAGCIPLSRVLVTTNLRYESLVADQLPGIPPANLLLETAKRNTAPAIALAAHLLCARDPEAVMVALPADHMVLDRSAFYDTMAAAVDVAVRGHLLVTLGITPDRPATEYGYIQHGAPVPVARQPTYRVARFVEKPDAATATRFLAEGGYYWNSGMFIWEAATILAEIRRCLPRLAATVGRPDFFTRAEAVSIDYGVMERSDHAAVIPSDFGWSDVGSWEGLKALVEREGLSVHADVQRYLDTLA
ncbi:MAG: mannose-1-phosphate guanylyltransferase [Deltaproteobacteria bacterium]|nr:mannose-1-phosphate guanylyltransferase [Deltaproteobacteria bacterium]